MTNKAKSKRTKKTYDIDGYCFRTKPIYDLYCELKEAKKEGLVNRFELPDIKTTASSKYKAQKCQINGHHFDSVMEGRFYFHLLREKKNKRVKYIELQPEFTLQEGFSKNGKKIRPIKYRADFLVTYPKNEKVVYDVKGKKTPEFALKQKIFDYRFPDLKLECVKYTVKKGWHCIDR